MADLLDYGDQDIRRLMRHPSYRAPGAAGDEVRALVRSAFQARYPGPLERDATGRQTDGIVNVRAYERERDGRTEHVSAYQRSAGDRADSDRILNLNPEDGGEGNSQADGHSSERPQELADAYTFQQRCEDQFHIDMDLCARLPPGMRRSCRSIAADRFVQCGRNAYIMPLIPME